MAETAARKQDARAQGRRVDRIDTAPRFTETDAIRLNNLFRGSDTQDMLRVLRDRLAAILPSCPASARKARCCST
jgi:phosphoadenosine phosphosulfate reductase